MKTKTNYFIILLLSVFSFNVRSQNLNLNYGDGSNSFPLQSNTTVTIDSNNGDVNVSTSDTAAQIGTKLGLQPTGNAPAISFVVTPNGTTSATIDATIVNDAIYCDKSNLWSGLITSNPPVDYVNNVSQTVTANGNNYTLTCGNSFGVSTENASVSNVITVLNPVVTISASPFTVASGGSSTVSWTVTNSPTTCDFTGDWPGGGGTNVVPANFPASSFVLSNITTAKTLSVVCDNSAVGNSGIKTVTINVSGGSSTAWASCPAPQQSILNNAEDRTIIANSSATGGTTNGTFYQFYGSSTPSNLNMSDFMNATFGLSLTRNQYVAGQFNIGNETLQAKFSFTLPGGTQGAPAAFFTATISECPGEFNIHNNQSTCKITGTNSSLFWSTNPSSNPATYCLLDKNKTYYLNMVHADAGVNNYGTSACNTAYCGILGVPRIVN